jgi:hypothetical protein
VIERRRNGLRGRAGRALYTLGTEPKTRWRHLWRDFMPLLGVLIAAYAVFGFEGKVDQAAVDARIAKSSASNQAEGRRIAIAVLCGFGNGVELAGKASISTPVQPPRFRRNLEKLGLPSARLRAPAARKAGEAYARAISESVVEQAGADAKTVIKPDGSLNCSALQGVANTAPLP